MRTATQVGRRLGGYQVERELGAGGMGMVVLARQESLDRPAVLKRIHPQWVSDEELEARFEREAIAAARVHHTNVVSVYDRFQVRGQHYLATEYIDGLDLAAILEKESRFPWRIAALLALEVARGLEAIHAEGMLHRDMKPQNLLVGRTGAVKITDFGLVLDPKGSVLTQPGVALGTPPYMAPEQLRGERVDPRADLFAFGCVLYEMLTSKPPFDAPREDEAESMLERVEAGRYVRVRARHREIPRALERIVRGCLRSKAHRRFASVPEVRMRLEALLDRPTHEACRLRIAAFLWDRSVFERRGAETVVRVAGTGTIERGRPLRVMLAAAAVSLSLLLGAVAWLQPDRVVAVTDSIAREMGVRITDSAG